MTHLMLDGRYRSKEMDQRTFRYAVSGATVTWLCGNEVGPRRLGGDGRSLSPGWGTTGINPMGAASWRSVRQSPRYLLRVTFSRLRVRSLLAPRNRWAILERS